VVYHAVWAGVNTVPSILSIDEWTYVLLFCVSILYRPDINTFYLTVLGLKFVCSILASRTILTMITTHTNMLALEETRRC
jgi:hypothetical protein